MPRAAGDRPLPVPPSTKNFAFISQFFEIPQDTVFTVEFSVRAVQVVGSFENSPPMPQSAKLNNHRLKPVG